MNSTCESSHPPFVEELTSQINALEERFVELFINGSSRDLLKKTHLQLVVLKTELQLKYNQSL
jgi:hypothetical protein